MNTRKIKTMKNTDSGTGVAKLYVENKERVMKSKKPKKPAPSPMLLRSVYPKAEY